MNRSSNNVVDNVGSDHLSSIENVGLIKINNNLVNKGKFTDYFYFIEEERK